MLSDLTNLFDESLETCVSKSLSTSVTQKNQIIMTIAVFFNSFNEINFSKTFVQTT